MSRAQSSDTSKKETAKKPVLGKFGNLFGSNRKRNSKNSPTSPTSPNGEKPVSPSKDIASSKSAEKDLLKDNIKSPGSVTLDCRGQNQAGAKSSPADTASGSARKKTALNQTPKENTSGKVNQKWTNLNRGSDSTGQSLNRSAEGESPSVIAVKDTNCEPAANGLPPSPESYSHPQSQSGPSVPQEEPCSGGSLQGAKGCLNGTNAPDLTKRDADPLPKLPTEKRQAPDFEESKSNGKALQVPGKEVSLDREMDRNSSRASQGSKKTATNVTSELQVGNSEVRKAKQVFRVSIGNKGCEPENPSLSNSSETEENLNPSNSFPKESVGNVSVKQTKALLEQLSMAKEPAKESKESPTNPSDSVNPGKVLTVDIYLTKTEESPGNTPVPSTPKEGPADAESVEMRSNSSKKSGKKRRSFRFNASQSDGRSAAEPAAGEGPAPESLPPGDKAASPVESSAASAQPEPGTASPGRQEPRAATHHKVSPRGEPDKSKQQLAPAPASKRKAAARESQPASPTARKSQLRDPLRSQPSADNGQPATKAAAAGDKDAPPGPSAGTGAEPPSAPPADSTGGGPGLPPADSPTDPRRLQRENSTGKRAAAHPEGRPAKREHDRPAAPGAEAARARGSPGTAPRGTVTSKLHIPAKPKNVDLNLKTKRVDSLESVEETADEQPINRGNTANKISLFENKGTNQSLRQIDFCATKSFPLTKKYVGRAKLKFGKQAKETEQVEDISTNRQYGRQKSHENDQPVEKIKPEVKEKFEKAVEVETTSKVEAGKGISPKKKGKTVGSQLTQSHKPNLQADAMSLDVSDSEPANVDKDSMQPNAASLHQQVNELQQDNGTKGIAKDSDPQESTGLPVKSKTKSNRISTLTAQEEDSSPAITLTPEGDPPPLNVTSESSNAITNEHGFAPKETSVEIAQNIEKPQDSKSSVKAPTRKAERSVGKKNDRQKKKQSETETSSSQEKVHFQQSTQLRENHKTEEDLVDTQIADKANTSDAITSKCATGPSQLTFGAEISHGEKISMLGMQNEPPANFTESMTEHTSISRGNISPKLDKEVSAAKEITGGLARKTTSEMEKTNVPEITDSPKQVDCVVSVKENTRSSEEVNEIGESVTENSFSQHSRSSMEGSIVTHQTPPVTDIQEFTMNSKDTEKNVVHPSSEAENNWENSTVETDFLNQRALDFTNERAKRELSEQAPLLSISGTPQEKNSQDSVSQQQSVFDLQQAEVNKPTADLLNPEESKALSLETSSGKPSPVICAVIPKTSDSEQCKNSGPAALSLHNFEDVPGVLGRTENILTLKSGKTEGTLQKESIVDLTCPKDTENKLLPLEPTEHINSLAVTMHHLENVSDVQQSEESTVVLKSGTSKDVSSQILPVGPGENHLPTDSENKRFQPEPPSTDNIPIAVNILLPVLQPDSHDIHSDTLEQQEEQLTSSQTDAHEKDPLQNGSSFLKQEILEDENINTTPHNADTQTTKTQTLPEVDVTQYVQPSKEGEQRVYDQSSYFTDFVKNSKLANAEVYSSGYQTDAQHMEYNIQDSVFTTNVPYSNGILENGMHFDRNGMFNQRCPAMVFNVSPASDDSLDSSTEMEKFTEIIRKLDSPISVPQKRKKQRVPRSPQPSFGLPPIHEDYLEKIFDSNIFKFGLGKERTPGLAPALMLKMQSTDTATRVRPKRASNEQSLLLKSMRSSNKDVPLPCEEAEGKENSDAADLDVKRSRLEKSTIFSSLKSPLMATSKENMFSPSATSIDTITTSFSTYQNDSNSVSPKSFDATVSSNAPQKSEVTQTSIPHPGPCEDLLSGHSSNCETNFPNPSHAALKVPSYMEKYLKTDDEKHEQNVLSVIPQPDNVCTNLPKTDLEFAATFNDRKTISGPLESTPKAQLGNVPTTDEEFSNQLKPNPAMPTLDVETLIANGPEKINPRPGKLVIFGEPNFCGNTIEIFADVPDCSSWELSPIISIKIVRGCWLLYEKPNFEGLSIPLEEGEMELTNLWGEELIEEKGAPPTVIGSLRQVVTDYRVCQIDLFTEADGLGLVTSYFDDTEEVQVFDRLQKTCSIKVHWGVWLIYEDSGFQGVPFILEPGEYSNLAFWDTHEAYIGSMRPLKMGGRKVEIPNEPKIFVYEKSFFEGTELELDGEVFRLSEEQCNSIEEQSEEEQAPSFATVGSMRVLGGVWVGYEKPGFKGHQYLLEEGDYPQWSDWGGYNEQLQSFRPILADFSSSHMIMYTDKDFGEKGSNINVLGIISNMEDTGYGIKTQSINVLSGVWVAYEFADFTGKQYLLEKGMYSSFEDWGANNFKISSVQPIVLDAIGSPMGKFKVLLFSEPEFQGSIQIYEDNTNQIDDSFIAKSCKVLAGSWVAFDGEDFSGHQYILEEGTYPDLCSIGCQPNTSLKSLHIIDYEFSEPNIVLYGKQHYKGKKIEFTTETVNLQCLGYNSRISSVQVLGGLWVIYQYSNYRGRQILMSPDKIPDWYTISGWHSIGSLRPLIQKRVYFRIRNKSTGMFVSTNGNLDDLKLLRLQVTEDTGAEDQIWAYHEGSLKCRIAEDCCVAVSGSLVTAGSKLGLSLEEKNDNQYWSISPEGRIHSRMKPNLVLDIKGGTQYDQKHIILNTISEGKETQCWELLVL